MNDLSISHAQAKLDAFLVDNEELEALNARLSAFNLFQVLRISRAEIRHSNILAWLLTPNETHGLGANFLRRFISRLLLNNEVPQLTFTASQFELMNLGDVEVLREWHHIDIVVRSSARKWCLLIENKVGSRESQGQLNRYMERVRSEMPDYQIIPVFLTLLGDDPSETGLADGYLSLSHVDILALAEQTIRQNSKRIPEDVQLFLSHYLDTLRRLTMQDEALIELCKTIYRKHREAIELIVEYGSESNIQKAAFESIQKLVECDFAAPFRRGVWFLPKSIAVELPANVKFGWPFLPKPTPIAIWTFYAEKKSLIRMVLEVGPVEDPANRKRLLSELETAGLTVRGTGYKDNAKYTRLLNVTQKLKLDQDGNPDESDEELKNVITALWSKFVDPVDRVAQALKRVSWQ